MILQALNDYHLRKVSDPDASRRLPALGSEDKEIPFILELAGNGQLTSITDTRTSEGKKKIGTRYRVPKGVKKSSGIAANLLWENAEYVLATPDVKKLAEARHKGNGDEYLERLSDMQAAFKARIASLPPAALEDEGTRAVLAFLDASPADQAAASSAWPELASTNPVLSFRLAADATDLVCQRPAVLAALATLAQSERSASDASDGDSNPICLVTGEGTPGERVHTAIKGVWDAQSSGANIVSFNRDAFNSFGKVQGANAPVSPSAAFAYTTALNHLLDKGSRQRMQVGDASTVFWAQRTDDKEMEGWFAELFGGGDDPDRHAEQVRALYESLQTGRFGGSQGQNLFFVLGLAPNAARLSVRFWHAQPLSEIAARINSWFVDLRIVRGPNDLEFPPLKRLLAAVCLATKERPGGDIARLPQTIAGDVMRAILGGGVFPSLWLNTAVLRCRAEQHVSYLRACVIKACVNRAIRYANLSRATPEREISEMLDLDNNNPGYRLGRLFAVLERAQEDAAGGPGKLNATIRDRYYGAASSTPAAVFTTLLRLKNHHLGKLTQPARTRFEKLIGGISSGLVDFPGHLALPDQGRFALGYYHQRQALFTKRGDSDPPEPAAPTSGDD